MRVLFDTNVVLDVLLDRQPHAAAATQLFERVAQRRLQGLLGATTVTTIHYLAEKAVGRRRARGHLETLLGLFEVAAVDRAVLSGALELGFGDFEDAVLHETAAQAGATGIVTRDVGGFGTSRLTVYAPEELLTLVEAGPHG
jgi:predicted nucleic acid-binding protein